MKQKIIDTGTCELLLVELPEGSHKVHVSEFYANKISYLTKHSLHFIEECLPAGKWELLCKASEVTEEIIDPIVQSSIHTNLFAHYVVNTYCYKNALESWNSLLQANEVYFENQYQNPEEYEKRSAVYWAEEIKCPILIIHSKLDERVSFEQAEKMVEALEEAGKEYKFISYEDDVHGLHPEDFSIIMEWCQ